MKRKNTTFSRSLEERSYAGGDASVSEESLASLRGDMELWAPNLESVVRGKTVLDLGAGTGRHGILLARSFQPANVVSLDIVHRRLRAGIAAARELDRLSLVCGDGFALPFRDASFDCIIANSLLHHLPNLALAAKEIARVLRPGGGYIGREPNFNNPVVRFVVFGWRRHTPNEYPLRAQEIRAAFAGSGCRCEMVYFWRRFKGVHHRTLSAAISVRAQRL